MPAFLSACVRACVCVRVRECCMRVRACCVRECCVRVRAWCVRECCVMVRACVPACVLRACVRECVHKCVSACVRECCVCGVSVSACVRACVSAVCVHECVHASVSAARAQGRCLARRLALSALEPRALQPWCALQAEVRVRVDLAGGEEGPGEQVPLRLIGPWTRGPGHDHARTHTLQEHAAPSPARCQTSQGKRAALKSPRRHAHRQLQAASLSIRLVPIMLP